MELEGGWERITDPLVNCWGAGKDLSGRCSIFPGSQIRNFLQLFEVGA